MNDRVDLPQSDVRFTAPFVQCPAWSDLSWLNHGSSTRDLTAHSQGRCADVLMMQKLLGGDNQPIVLLNQRHTAEVAVLSEIPEPAGFDEPALVYDSTDAIVCTKPGITCAIFTADCVPIFVVDTRCRIFGLAHAGWKGSLHGITTNLIRKMVVSGADPQHMTAWIGPSISGKNYEVSSEMIGWFAQTFASDREAGCEFIEERLLDLPLLNSCLLQKAGIAASKIFDSSICTFQNHITFHSYRADGERAGRIVSLMSMV